MATFQHKILILLLQCACFVIHASGSHYCFQPTVGNCSCQWTGPYVTVTCVGLDTVPEKLPQLSKNTTTLKLIKGTIKEIPQNVFLSFTNLLVLDLQFNQISNKFNLPKTLLDLFISNNNLNASTIHGMFDRLTKLKSLDLNVNPLGEKLVPGTFSSIKKVERLYLVKCSLEDVGENMFRGLNNLNHLTLASNKIKTIKRGAFRGIGSQEKSLSLELLYNQISLVEDGAFEDIYGVSRLVLSFNQLSYVPNLKGLQNLVFLGLRGNKIVDVLSLAQSGIKYISYLDLSENEISVVPVDVFKRIPILTLDLSKNRIKHIPPRFLENPQTPQITNYLFLSDNQIQSVDKESFVGLQNIKQIHLFNNAIRHLPDGVFSNPSLEYLFLNKNNFTSLTAKPFKGMKKDGDKIIYVFSNDIVQIDDVQDLGNGTTIIIDCKDLAHLPTIKSGEIACSPNSLGKIKKLPYKMAETLSQSGFTCEGTGKGTFNWQCSFCKAGTFSNDDFPGDHGCKQCSAGGFYQDENGGTQCKDCSMGTYVHPNNTPGTTPLSCQACPQGTNTSGKAGYRACKCFTNFYRFDRFGRCFPCPSKAYKCEHDYASLSAGFYWRWENSTREKQYRTFIANLMIENPEFAERTWKYEGTLPNPHKCPRDSCLGGLNSSCEDGYQGPLCALCQQDYYNRINRCISCPSRLWAGLQVAIVIVLFVVILLALVWGDRKRLQNENGRTIADKILSCFKIVIGFYQVMAGVYSAFSNITWPSSVIWMQKILHFIQLNILQIAPLSCITPRLSFNVLQQFVIVVVLNISVVTFILIYLVIRIAVLRRRRSSSPNQIDESVAKTKSSCIRNICVFLFATYPKTCTSIIQVLSINCVQLCYSDGHAQCDSYLRSDLSVQCHTPKYAIFSRIAAAFLVYPVGFPVVILILVWKYIHRQELEDQNGYEEIDAPAVDAFRFTPPPRESPFKSGLSLFSENYRSNCWYWESLEMIRKLVLISGLTLIGEHSRTQIGLGAIISAIFAILYVYKRPITNKFENLLQTVALMAIFLNLGIGVMLKATDHANMSPVINKHNDNVGVSIMMIIINVAVIGIVTVAVLKVFVMLIIRCCRSAYENNCSCGHCCRACLTCCLSLLLPCKMGNGNFMHYYEIRNEHLQETTNSLGHG